MDVVSNEADDDYRQLAAFVAIEKARAAFKPQGFFGNWAFHVAQRRAFSRLQVDDADQQSGLSAKASAD